MGNDRQPRDGLECARCGCYQSEVDKTVKLPSLKLIRRYRVCCHCGHRFTSVEVLVRDIPRSHFPTSGHSAP